MTRREYEDLIRRMNQQMILNRRRSRAVVSGISGYANQVSTAFGIRVVADGGTFESQTCINDEINDIGQTFFDACSFVYIPGGYKANKIYAVKPTSGAGDLTFARTSIANRWNNNTWESIATGIPAIHYYNSTCPFLSLMPQRTNLLLNSTTLSTQNVTVSAVAHVLSFFGTGTVTLSGASTAGPLVGTSDTVRSELSFTPSAGTLTLTVTGNVYFGQLEQGAYVSRWITTAGASATRNAESITALTGVSSLIGQTEGTVYLEASSFADSTAKIFSVSDGTNNNRILISFGASNTIVGQINTGGVIQAQIASSAFTTGTIYKVALTYASNYAALFVNGVKIGEDLTVTVPATSQIRMDGGAGTLNFYGNVWDYSIDNVRLSDADAIALTL